MNSKAGVIDDREKSGLGIKEKKFYFVQLCFCFELTPSVIKSVVIKKYGVMEQNMEEKNLGVPMAARGSDSLKQWP